MPWSPRYWPTLVLIALAGPFWILLRSWFHARMLMFTLLGFASLLPLMFLSSFLLIALGAPGGGAAHVLWP